MPGAPVRGRLEDKTLAAAEVVAASVGPPHVGLHLELAHSQVTTFGHSGSFSEAMSHHKHT